MSAGNIDPKVIAAIPLAVQRTIPAAQPPAGVQANFEDPDSRVSAIIGVSSAFLVIAVFCYTIRMYTKLAISKTWKWDDLTITIGFALSIVYCGAVFNGSLHGATGKHQWDVHLDRVLSDASLLQSYLTVVMATPALGLIKCSLFIQYYLLFRRLKWVRITVWIGATICALFYIPVTITAFALCSPRNGVIGMVIDWYLLILPIPAVMTLEMNFARKLGVLVVFMTGGLAAIASTVSLYYRVLLQTDPTDTTWKVGFVLLWSQIEMFAGVTASSMPAVKHFFTRHSISLTSWGSSLKTSFTHLLSSRGSGQEKFPTHSDSFTEWDRSPLQSTKDQLGSRVALEELDSPRSTTTTHKDKAPQIGQLQIQVTKDVFVVREPWDEESAASFKNNTTTDRHDFV